MSLFTELGIVIGVALTLSLIMKLLKQPLIVGHILTGLIVGPFITDSGSIETFTLFSEIGIAILLFTVGLNLSPKTIKEFGTVSLITGVGQVVITSILGYFVSIWLGFPPITSIYIAVALAFSSTIIILKLLSDKGDIETLYAKISIGFLLVQDFIAIILLFIIPLVSETGGSLQGVAIKIGLGILMVVVTFFIAFSLFPKLDKFLSSNTELLFLFAMFWGIGIANIFKFGGFSIETGALIAGISLSTLASRHEISARMSALRDFFIIIFFILLGSKMTFGSIGAMLPEAMTFSLLVLIGNPIILMIIMGLLGYKKKTSLQTGFTVAQVSEFSLILMALGVTYGHVTEDALSLVTLVALITIFGSSYLILYSEKIFKKLSPYLSIFEKENVHEKKLRNKKHSIILFGCNRIGHDFIEKFKEQKHEFLVIDHNPETVEMLDSQGIDVEYGDASNIAFLDEIDASSVELVISTIPDTETNLLINRILKSKNKDTVVLVVANKVTDALGHYDEGVDYVILPHFLGAKYAAELVIKMKEKPEQYSKLKDDHIKSLKLRLSIGHEHPGHTSKA